MGLFLTLLFITISLVSPGVLPAEIAAIHIEKVIMVIAVFATIFRLAQVRFSKVPEAFLLAGLFVAVCFSNLANGWAGGALSAFNTFLPCAVIFYLIICNCSSLKRLKFISNTLAIISLFLFGCFILTQVTDKIASPYFTFQQVGDQSIKRYHGLGFLSDPNDTAQFFVAVLPLLFLGWYRRSSMRKLLMTLVPASLLVLGVLMTHSRGAMFALGAIILFGLRRKLGTVTSLVLTLACCAVLLALNLPGGRGMTNDDGGRVATWSTGLAVFKSAPIFGVGFSRFQDFSDTGMTAHNSFVLCLSELGLFGYFFWIGLIVFAVLGLHWVQRNNVDRNCSIYEDDTSDIESADKEQRTSSAEIRDFATAVQTSLFGFLTAAFFLSRTYTLTLYILLAIAVSVLIIDRRLREAKPKITLLLKRTLATTGLSVVVLYAIVRLHWAV